MLMIWNAVLKTQAVKILMRECKGLKNLIIIVIMVNLIINRKLNIMMIMMIVMRVMKKSPVYRNLRKLRNRNRK